MTDKPLREVMARGMYEDEHTGPNDTPWPELPDVHRMAFGHLADAAIAAIEASGTYVAEREYEALARAARAYLEHPVLASAADTLRGMVQRAERVLAARPRDAASTDKVEA